MILTCPEGESFPKLTRRNCVCVAPASVVFGVISPRLRNSLTHDVIMQLVTLLKLVVVRGISSGVKIARICEHQSGRVCIQSWTQKGRFSHKLVEESLNCVTETLRMGHWDCRNEKRSGFGITQGILLKRWIDPYSQ